MKNSRLRRKVRRFFGGFAGLFLILILGVAGMVLVFALYTGSMNPFTAFHGGEADRYSDPNACPWEEGNLFVNPLLDGYDMGGRRPPFRAQPKIEEEMIRYIADIYDEEEDRVLGQVILRVHSNGDARASWTGEFRVRGRPYKAMVETEKGTGLKRNLYLGNIAPLKIYKDENGRDRSKLYVITEGFYHLQDMKRDNALMGAGYVTAWISKDYSAVGKLWLPGFDDGELVVYAWGPAEPSEE